MEGENDILHDVNSDAFKNFNQILEAESDLHFTANSNYSSHVAINSGKSIKPQKTDDTVHRSIIPRFVTPTTPSCIDNSWRSTTLPAADSAGSNQTLPIQDEHEWVMEKLR